ncbi:MAG: hypothetical protein HDR22_11480 [Lachnospiraceae bacterium]|nr:hypothetical protein [Lachnospiraceae bacterium]
MTQIIEQMFITVLNMSLTAGIVILAVILLRFFLKKAPKIFSHVLWAVVLFRLLCPVSFSSALSLFEVLHKPSVRQGQINYIPENIGLMSQPKVNFPVPFIEDAVNASLPAATLEKSVNPMQLVVFFGACLWLAGIFIMAAHSIIAYWRLQKRLKTAIPEEDNIYRTHDITTPFVCGIFSPRIYLPSTLLEQEKKYILLHEQIHLKRKDYIWRIVSYFALCIHWFNPLVWLAFFLSGKDMEMSCDEAVIRILGSGVKKEYSASLLALASGRHIMPGIPLAFGEGETGSRIKNVLRYKKPAHIVIGIIIAVCVPVAVILTANPKADNKSEENAEVIPAKEKVPEIYHADMDIDGEIDEDTGGDMDGETELVQIAKLTSKHVLSGNIADGMYRLYVRSLSRSAKGIDGYLVDDDYDYDGGEDLPFLAFADNCKFSVNEEMDTPSYGEVSFDSFADLAEEAFSYLNPPLLLTFENGLIVEAVLESYYGSGISYAAAPLDTFYADMQESTGLDGGELLASYYTLDSTEKADIGDSPGLEEIMVYTGNIGDGKSGIVFFNSADGTPLYSDSAHVSRAGWNNIYLGERDGNGFIMTVHIEDRDMYGEYDYYVFRLSEEGEIRQIAGSSFIFDDDRIPYDDALFAAWAEKLEGYLADSYLLLSTQDGELRTEHISEAEKYNYETLKREKGGA